ncbi:hypothetical protein CHL67_08265 [Prosthecochloris sp. GSB1]|uniref:TolC family outer membrane protein n=1 Tax=Prosthecochloris sp. GSB1 TaxID=281093 RepID=UPI000B8CD372|nr:TolC family outer membrane protein [Prosthecochloris sp. GSB1]ASQ90913.1 hypothetical protein CHL67_08265 [Prosthecochloris sp. GSB1]
MRMTLAGILVVALFLPAFAKAAPLDLMDAWEQALAWDPWLRVSRADNAMQQEEARKAKAGLLPSVSAQGSAARKRTSQSGSGFDPRYYNALSGGVILRQPLLNLERHAAYRQAKAVGAKSDHMLEKETSRLMILTTEAYFNVLYAEGSLGLVAARTEAAQAKLAQAEKALQNGLGTVTAVDFARADHDKALAEDLSARNALEFSRRELERITGVYSEKLLHLNPKTVALQTPEPPDVQQWIAQALQRSHDLGMARDEVEIARQGLRKSSAAGLPTLDLVAARSYSDSETDYTINRVYDTWSLALQLKVPIYNGGYASASVRQARAGQTKAKEEYRMHERQVVSDVRKYHGEVRNAIMHVRALGQAVISSETLLKSMEKGMKNGLSSSVDVLDAKHKLLSARQELMKACYQYVLNWLMLKETAGTISEDDIRKVDEWLTGAPGKGGVVE